jgi:hypothetical protein
MVFIKNIGDILVRKRLGVVEASSRFVTGLDDSV